ETHVLHRLGGKRRAQAAGAEEDESFAAGEDRLVVGALGVDPEFEHAARRMQRAGHAAFALQFARVADVDQHDIVSLRKHVRLLRRQNLDLCIRLGDQRLVALLHRHRRVSYPRLSSLKKSFPLSSMTMKAGKSSTSMRQIA